MTFGAGENEVPVWSPDGKEIAYAANGRHKLYVFPVDGSSPERPLTDMPGHFHPESWSPDGKLIAMEVIASPSSWQVWMLPVTGDHRPYRYLANLDRVRKPTFSPDGRLLAYASQESGDLQVYVTRFPGPGETVQVSTAGGTDPVWSRDGHELYYLRPDDAMMRASVMDMPRLMVGKPEMLFHADFWHAPIAGEIECYSGLDGVHHPDYKGEEIFPLELAAATEIMR